MINNHTPGAWIAINSGQMVFTEKSPYGHGQMHIADVRGWGHLTGGGACNLKEEDAIAIQEANARLIAAAPELLEACKEALKLFSGFENCPAQPILEKAILKAEGA